MSVTPCMGWEMLVCMSQAPPPRSSSSLTAKNKGEIPSPTACKNPPPTVPHRDTAPAGV